MPAIDRAGGQAAMEVPDWLVAEEVPAWFWNVIETHAPSTTSLVAWLRAATADEIVGYQLAYELAAEAVADYWDGPVVDGVAFSEDDTEDLCKWVVAQGRQAWETARSGRAGLDEAVRRYADTPPQPDPWTPDGPAHTVFFDRFGSTYRCTSCSARSSCWRCDDAAVRAGSVRSVLLRSPSMTAQRYRLGVDFGTSTTIAMLQRPDGRVQPLLFDGSPLLSSAVLLGPDRRLHTGRDAAHLARSAPERLEPNPKRRIDETSVLLGDAEVPVAELVVAVLSRVANEAARVAGPVRDIVLTHPANWGQNRRSVLVGAARQLGFTGVELVGEPTAAATYFAYTRGGGLPLGSCVLVYDLGAGTCDVTLLRRTPQGFEPVASDGLNDVGGLDVDAAVIGFLQATYGELWTSPATRRQLWDDVRSAKEMLSRASGTVVMVPALAREVPLGREQLEGLARPVLRQTIAMTRAMVLESGVGVTSIAGLFLVGGASRTPLVATLLHEALGIAPIVAEQPELVVAEGSLYLNVIPAADPQTAATPTPSAPFPATGSLTAAGPAAPPGPFTPAAPVSPTGFTAAPVSPTGFASAPVSPVGVPAGPVSGAGMPAAPVSPVSLAGLPVSPPGPYATGAVSGAPAFGAGAGATVGSPYAPPTGPPFGPPPAGPLPQHGPGARGRRSPALVAVLVVVGLLVLVGGGVAGYTFLNGTNEPTGNGPASGAPGTSGGQQAAGTLGPGRYDLAKLPEELCKTVDASVFYAKYDKEQEKPKSSRSPNSIVNTDSCTISRSHIDAKTSAFSGGSIIIMVFAYSDVAYARQGHQTEVDNAKLAGPNSAVPGLGEEAVVWRTHDSDEQDKTILRLTIAVRDSNLRLVGYFTGSRSDSAGWSQSEVDDLQAKLVSTAKTSFTKTVPSIKR